LPLLVGVEILGAVLCILLLLSGLLTAALLSGLLTALLLLAALLLAGLLAWSLVRIRHQNLHFLSRTTCVPYVNRQAPNTFLASSSSMQSVPCSRNQRVALYSGKLFVSKDRSKRVDVARGAYVMLSRLGNIVSLEAERDMSLLYRRNALGGVT
jgi:hypothetical protein